MSITTNKTIGEIVADDFRTAAIFKKHGIDFCCKGGRTIDEACEKKGVEKNALISELEALPKGNSNEVDVRDWPLDLLANYIVRIHHQYVRDKTPMLLQFLDKLCRVHGERHPELFESIVFLMRVLVISSRILKKKKECFSLLSKAS